MKVLNFGSLNIDYVYEVDSLPSPGETACAESRVTYCGGKGLNRAVALAKAKIPVTHAGSVGSDGNALIDALREAGVNTDYVLRQDGISGHTVIEADEQDQRTILSYGGTNMQIPREHIDRILMNFSEGDMLLVDNEINEVGYIIEQAHARGMTVLYSPSPFDQSVFSLPLDFVDCFIVNQGEGEMLTETRRWENIIPKLARKYPGAHILLTLGDKGAKYCNGSVIYHQNIYPVKPVDPTAAGDAFVGYFVYGLISGLLPQEAMKIAAKAASITITRKGAAESIPAIDEVMATDKASPADAQPSA